MQKPWGIRWRFNRLYIIRQINRMLPATIMSQSDIYRFATSGDSGDSWGFFQTFFTQAPVMKWRFCDFSYLGGNLVNSQINVMRNSKLCMNLYATQFNDVHNLLGDMNKEVFLAMKQNGFTYNEFSRTPWSGGGNAFPVTTARNGAGSDEEHIRQLR